MEEDFSEEDFSYQWGAFLTPGQYIILITQLMLAC